MGRLNTAKMKEQYDEMSRMSTDFWRPDTGKTTLRFLPGWDSSDEEVDTFEEAGCQPSIIVTQHYLGGEVKRMVICPETIGINRNCPICDISRKYRKSKDEIKIELGNDLKVRRRAYWNVLVRRHEEEGVKVYPVPMGIHEQLFEYGINTGPWKEFFDENAGCDVELTRKGSGKNTEYSIVPLPDRCGLGKSPKENAAILKAAPDLTKFLTASTREELIRLLRKMEGDPDVPFSDDLGVSPADDLEAEEEPEAVQATLPPPPPVVAAVPQASAEPPVAAAAATIVTPIGSAQEAQDRLERLRKRMRSG